MDRALADLEARLEKANPAVLKSLRPGLDSARATALLRNLEPTPDAGLVSLYKWRNGGDVDLIRGARFYSLEEAIESRAFELRLAAEVESLPDLRAAEIFDPRWFPILEDAGGLLYVVENLGRGRALLFDRQHIGNPEELGASLVEFIDGIARDGADFKPPPLSAAAKVLVSRLESGEPGVRWSAVRELTRKRPAEAFEPLVAMLGSSDAHARGDAALLLGALGDPRAIPILAGCAKRWTGNEVTSARAALSQLAKLGSAGPNGES